MDFRDARSTMLSPGYALQFGSPEAAVSVQFRYLQTLTEIGVEKNTTVVFPVPVDIFWHVTKALQSEASAPVPAEP